MPNQKAKRFCGKMGCSQLVDYGYCSAHKKDASDTWTQKQKNKVYDRRWAKVRRLFLYEHPLCADCLENGVIKSAQEVHHIKKARAFPELRLEWSNLLALCKPCHYTRTARGE